MPADRIKATTVVGVEPPMAFRIFTEETDLWWRRGPAFRFGGEQRGVLRFEAAPTAGFLKRSTRASSRSAKSSSGPGARLVFQWRIRNFAPGECTEVEVRFEPHPSGTQVILEHRGFAALRKDHPVRHGMDDNAFCSFIGRWWGELLLSMRSRAASRNKEDE